MPNHSFIGPDGVVHSIPPEMLEGSLLGKILDEMPEGEELHIMPFAAEPPPDVDWVEIFTGLGGE